MVENLHRVRLPCMVDGGRTTGDDDLVRSRAELALAFVAVVSAAAAIALAGTVDALARRDTWIDGASGARLWVFVAVVPVVMIGLVTVGSRRGERGRLPVLG